MTRLHPVAFLQIQSPSNIQRRFLSFYARKSTRNTFPFKFISNFYLTVQQKSFVFQFSRAYSDSRTAIEEDVSLFPVPLKAPTKTSKSDIVARKFDSVNLHENIKKALEITFQFKDMSIVQDKVLSLMPTRKDMLVRAKTGTGKTLAFIITAIEKLRLEGLKEYSAIESGRRGVSILIISPTRELALQICQESKKLCRFLPFGNIVLVGGESKASQLKAMAGRSDIVIATPVLLFNKGSFIRCHGQSSCPRKIKRLQGSCT